MKFKAVLLLGILLAGCGGGGGGTSGGPVPKSFPLSTITRILQIGDLSTYKLTGTVHQALTNRTVNITGTLSYSVSTLQVGSGTLPSVTSTLNFIDSTGITITSSSTTYYFQNGTTHEIDELGDTGGTNNTARSLTSPLILAPGTWSTAFRLNTPFSFTNGQSGTATITVLDSEAVSTPYGNFQAWKTLQGTISPSGTSNTATDYYVPALGNFVREDGTAVINGDTYAYTAVLTATNVPL